jgi:hypothetical protein
MAAPVPAGRSRRIINKHYPLWSELPSLPVKVPSHRRRRQIGPRPVVFHRKSTTRQGYPDQSYRGYWNGTQADVQSPVKITKAPLPVTQNVSLNETSRNILTRGAL